MERQLVLSVHILVMVGFFDFGGGGSNLDMSVDEIEDKIEEYERKKSRYESGLEQLRKAVKKIEAVTPEEWVRYPSRDRIARMKKRSNHEMLFMTDEFMRRHGTPRDMHKALNRAFEEFEPASSEREDEANIRAEGVKQVLKKMADKIENDHLPEIESTVNDLKRMKHDKKANEDFETGLVEDPSEGMKEDLIETIPDSEYNQELAEIEVEKEMKKEEENIENLMSLEEIAYFIAEDMRSELEKGEYDIDFVQGMVEMYQKHTEEIRDCIRPTDSEDDLVSQLENLHNQSEYIGPLKGAHIMYIAGRVYEGNSRRKVDDLRTFT